MFTVKVDSAGPQMFTPFTGGADKSLYYLVTEVRGGVRFFRQNVQVHPSGEFKGNLLFIPAVPNYLSIQEFLGFCGAHFNRSLVSFIRGDGIDNRYSVVIEVADREFADDFIAFHNGKRFDEHQKEFCHVYQVISVDLVESAEYAAKPLAGFTELPTCPVCLERLDEDTSGISDEVLCDKSQINFSCQICRLCERVDERPSCGGCGMTLTSWICVLCGFIGCGRLADEHRYEHWKDTTHSLVLEFETLNIWDSVKQDYVHRDKSNETTLACLPLDGVEENDYSFVDAGFLATQLQTTLDWCDLLTTLLASQKQHTAMLISDLISIDDQSVTKVEGKAYLWRIWEIRNGLETLSVKNRIFKNTHETVTNYIEEVRKDCQELEKRESVVTESKDEQTNNLGATITLKPRGDI